MMKTGLIFENRLVPQELQFVFGPFSDFLFSTNMARFVFRFVSGSLFPQARVFNSFFASCFGSFLSHPATRSFVFSSFSGSFFNAKQTGSAFSRGCDGFKILARL